jgi:hypothetical protein
VATLLVTVSLDWSAPEHFDAERSRPCRCCGSPTRMRDGQGEPCHMSCAENELARELGAGTARIADERGPRGE